jgi:hypothetical protein
MKRRPKDIGTVAETAVARVFQANGFPYAERRSLRGVHDAGDITGVIGVCISVKGGAVAKAARPADLAKWRRELAVQQVHARAEVGLLVLQTNGFGTPRADQWRTGLTLGVIGRLMHPHDARDDIYDLVGDEPSWMSLIGAIRLLRAAGLGDPLPTPSAGDGANPLSAEVTL